MADNTTDIYQEIQHEAFWRENFPELHIGKLIKDTFRESVIGSKPSDDPAENAKRLKFDGYFQSRDDTLARVTPALSRAAFKCHELGLSPLFLFVFDEAWQCFYSLHHQIFQTLGDYKVLPAFWVWYVDPTKSEAGWPPHRDKGKHALDADGNPLALTAWIPLTEATPLSSCMYILPKSRDPVYGTEQENDWQFEYPSIRALPAKPGDFFFWDQAVLHWGSTSSPYAEAPRISMALEFQRADIKSFTEPLMPSFCNPDFKLRLWLISKTIKEHNQASLSQPG